MVTSGSARVVLIGKSKNKNKTQSNILQDINPTEIPKEFINKITLTFEGDQEIEFDPTGLKENFTVDGMNDWLSKVDKKGHVKLVEITLDLDLIMQSLQKGSDSIFAKYF